MSRSKTRGQRLQAATLGLCLAGLIGCAPRNVYVRGDSQAVPLAAGQPAPHAGWLLSDAAVADLVECCEARQSAPAAK